MHVGDGKGLIGVPGLVSLLLTSRDLSRIPDSPFAITPTRLGITSAHGFGIKRISYSGPGQYRKSDKASTISGGYSNNTQSKNHLHFFLTTTSPLCHPKSSRMATSLDYLKQTGTVVVSDSGEFESTYNIHSHQKIHVDE